VFTFTRSHGLPDHQVTALLEDDLGYLWCGSASGLFRVRLADLEAVATGSKPSLGAHLITVADGLPGNDISGRYSRPSACKLPDGRLAFATDKGVALLDPRRLESAAHFRPTVFVEEVRADGELIFGDLVALTRARVDGFPVAARYTQPNGANPKPGTQDSEPAVSLPPGQGRVFEFHLNAPDFTAPEAAHFRYRLEGYDREHVWHEAGTRRVAYYNNLPPGSYRFRAHVRNHRLVESATPAEFAFTLTPFYWQSAWFWTAVGLLGAAAVAGAFVVRERVVRRVESLKRQTAQAQLRARVAADLHDGLGANIARLSLLAEQAESGVKPEAATSRHITKITAAARELTRSVREIIWNANPADTSLDGLAAQLAQNTQELCEASGIACRLDLPLEFPSVRLSADQRSSLFFAAKEAVTNVIRHAHATQLDLGVQVVDQLLVIELRDDGRGFDPSISRPASLAGRHGLPNLRSRIESLDGRCEIRSALGSGTAVRFEIPLAKLGETSA